MKTTIRKHKTTNRDAPSPLCDCHGIPMNSHEWTAGRHIWICNVARAEKRRKQHERVALLGICISCQNASNPKDLGMLCRDCKNRESERNADSQIKKYQRLLSLDKNDPEYQAIVSNKRGINA